MKSKLTRILLAAGTFVAAFLVTTAVIAPSKTQAIGESLVIQAPRHLDVATPIGAQVAAGSQTTLTIPACPGSLYVYVGEIDLQYCTGAATTATGPVTTTTTNLSAGNTLAWLTSWPVTANTCYNSGGPFIYPSGLKAQLPGPVTIVSPAGVATMTFRINASTWCAE